MLLYFFQHVRILNMSFYTYIYIIDMHVHSFLSCRILLKSYCYTFRLSIGWMTNDLTIYLDMALTEVTTQPFLLVFFWEVHLLQTGYWQLLELYELISSPYIRLVFFCICNEWLRCTHSQVYEEQITKCIREKSSYT